MNSWAMATHRLPLRVPRPRASTGYGSVMSLELIDETLATIDPV